MNAPLIRALGFTWRAPDPAIALKGLFGGGSAPALPPPAPVTAMPDLNDPAILAAKNRQLLMGTGSGRQSTVLTGGSGNDYTGTKLGSQ